MPKCTATKQDGTPCNAWAVADTSPPRCAAHGGAHTIGAPAGNANARKHGLYATQAPLPELVTAQPAAILCSIDGVIADLAAKQHALSDYIDAHLTECDLAALIHLFAIHGQNASRLGRLLRDQRALSGAAADGIAGAIAQALDELSNELGVIL